MMKSQPFLAVALIGTFAVVEGVFLRQGEPTTEPPGAVLNGMSGGAA